jgi:hypothetical protein
MSKEVELLNSIHEKRFQILSHYLCLYGDRLEGKQCLYEKFAKDEIDPSSEDGEICMESLMDVELYEQQLNALSKCYRASMARKLK